MWHKASVEKFLKDRHVPPKQIRSAKSKMDSIAHPDGVFCSKLLKGILSPSLVKGYEAAWETDSSLQSACFGPFGPDGYLPVDSNA